MHTRILNSRARTQVPTGGATGCEVTPRALVYEGENYDPLSFSDMTEGVSTRLVPSACIVDPDLFDAAHSKLDSMVAMAQYLGVMVHDDTNLGAFELASRALREADGDAIRCTALLSGLFRTHFNVHGGFMHLLCRAIESRSDISYAKAMQSVLPVWLSRQHGEESFPFEGSLLSSVSDLDLASSSSTKLVRVMFEIKIIISMVSITSQESHSHRSLEEITQKKV